MSATAARVLIDDGQLSCSELAESCLLRIEQRDGDIRAWTHMDADRVMARAKACDDKSGGGMLRGLPIGIKDVIETVDMPTAYNSPIYAGRRTGKDAACVSIARQDGALIMGKTATVEFAMGGRRARTRNPHNLNHTPGASSSGSAAAVADFMVPLALGTQTAGSIVRPAAFTGIYAYKPSFGLVSLEGCRACAPSFDTIGWFARCVDDLELVAHAFRLSPFRPDAPPSPVPLRGLRIGLCRTPHWDQAESAARAALLSAADRLADNGATIIDLDLPPPFDRLSEAHGTVMSSEARASLLAEYLGQPADLAPDLRALVERGTAISSIVLTEAYDRIATCRVALDALFDTAIDVVLTPAAPGTAPEGLQTTGSPIFNGLWTALQAPCIAIPTGDRKGLPVGVQLVGRRYRDDRLLAIARTVAPVIERTPPLPRSVGPEKLADPV